MKVITAVRWGLPGVANNVQGTMIGVHGKSCTGSPEGSFPRFGPAEIMNTDQDSQFTLFLWTDRVKRAGIKLSMDGKSRFLDNIFVERLWRSLKYECVYRHTWESGSKTKTRIGKWMEFYNRKRPYSALARKPPAVLYWQKLETTSPDQQEQKAA